MARGGPTHIREVRNEIEWVLMTGGVRGIQALLSGSTSYYTGDPVGAIAVSLQGGDIVIIGDHAQPDSWKPRRAQGHSRACRITREKNSVANFGG